jgi:hypothetical protein
MDDSSFQLSDLTASDREALSRELLLGERICCHYLHDEQAATLESLDRTLDLWFSDESSLKPSPNQVALGIGSLFGELLCKEFGCRWVVVTDRNGCDLAALHIQSAWHFFPRHSVAKRLNEFNRGQAILQNLAITLERDVL